MPKSKGRGTTSGYIARRLLTTMDPDDLSWGARHLRPGDWLHASTRPVLVLSADAVNRSPLGLCIVAAITTTPQDPGVRVQLPAAAGEPQRVSYVLPYQVRTISHDRLRERIAIVSGEVLAEVVRRVGLMIKARS